MDSLRKNTQKIRATLGTPSPSSRRTEVETPISSPVSGKVRGGKMSGKSQTLPNQETLQRKDEETRSSARSSQMEVCTVTHTKSSKVPPPSTTTTECDNRFSKRVEFRWYGRAKKAYFTSNFLKWSSMVEMTPVLDGFLVCFDLGKGHYEFKFQVDGKWCVSHDYKLTQNYMDEMVNYIHNY